MEFAISQPKKIRLPRNEKQIHWLHSMPQMWPSGLPLAMTLTLNFQGQIWNFVISQPIIVRLPLKEKQIYRLNFRPQMWPSGLTLAMTLIFEFSRSNVTLTFYHMHGLDHGKLYLRMGGLIDIEQRGWEKVIHDLDCDHLVTKHRCKDLQDSDRGEFRCRRAVNSSSFSKSTNTWIFVWIFFNEISVNYTPNIIDRFYSNKPLYRLLLAQGRIYVDILIALYIWYWNSLAMIWWKNFSKYRTVPL